MPLTRRRCVSHYSVSRRRDGRASAHTARLATIHPLHRVANIFAMRSFCSWCPSHTCRCWRALRTVLSFDVLPFAVWTFPNCHRCAASGTVHSVTAGSYNPSASQTCRYWRALITGLFFACRRLSQLDISALPSLRTIGMCAFYQCESLRSVSLAGLPLLESIGTFCECGHLSSIDLSGLPSLRTIGNCAFRKCRSLQAVSLANLSLLESIGDKAFSGCGQLPLHSPLRTAIAAQHRELCF